MTLMAPEEVAIEKAGMVGSFLSITRPTGSCTNRIASHALWILPSKPRMPPAMTGTCWRFSILNAVVRCSLCSLPLVVADEHSFEVDAEGRLTAFIVEYTGLGRFAYCPSGDFQDAQVF